MVHPTSCGIATSEKFRVVFNCGAIFRGTSLNQNLLQGPDFSNNLVAVLSRFRQKKVAFIADIKDMFHQVLVEPTDCNSLRFLWWPNNDLSADPVDYQMLVHVFGAKSSPSVAGYALKKVAINNETNADERTLQTVRNNFYVDDSLCSVPNRDDAIGLINQLRVLLQKGGFHLSKFHSNCRSVLFSLPGSDRVVENVCNINVDKLPGHKTLGLIWNPQEDVFKVRIAIDPKPETRRGILSIASQIYENLGIVQPCILPMKRLLQTLCNQRLDWDQPISDNLREQWHLWLLEMAQLQQLSIPRCFKQPEVQIQSIQLHCFSDASSQGYGAVAYFRMFSQNGDSSTAFVMEKSRVAPLKIQTIPKLELSVAVKLVKFLHHELEYKVDSVHFWTDSTAVLQYIANSSTCFDVFVANRLAIIHDGSKVEQ